MAKYLMQFYVFQWAAFAAGKTFAVTGCSEWADYESKEVLGSKVTVAIVKDDTVYKRKPGETTTNLYEKLDIKVPKKGFTVPIGSNVELVNPVATVFGQYNNMLSVRADDIKVVAPSVPPAKG